MNWTGSLVRQESERRTHIENVVQTVNKFQGPRVLLCSAVLLAWKNGGTNKSTNGHFLSRLDNHPSTENTIRDDKARSHDRPNLPIKMERGTSDVQTHGGARRAN